jgi:hypothetical protein
MRPADVRPAGRFGEIGPVKMRRREVDPARPAASQGSAPQIGPVQRQPTEIKSRQVGMREVDLHVHVLVAKRLQRVSPLPDQFDVCGIRNVEPSG